MTTYFKVAYDNEASGPFVAEGADLTWAGGSGFIVSVIDDGTTGILFCALLTGVVPNDNDVLTQGTTTADANEPIAGSAPTLLYPAYQREDSSVAANGDVRWTGPALGATHSFFFSGQTTNVVAGEILTFVGGQQCEVITVESDAGATGELSVRWITNLDEGLPSDGDTFTGDIAGDGALDGVVHPRCYLALELHRFLSDLNDDEKPAGNDVMSRIDPVASARSTDDIIALQGAVNIDNVYVQHMYGGSVRQGTGVTEKLYSGLNVQVTSPLASTEPVLIQDDAIVTSYWKNAFMPDSIQGNIRLMIATRADGVDIDGKRIKGKLLEFGEIYFEGQTTLGTGQTALALFSSPDGNNNTPVGTVAGAPYNSIVIVEGYQLIDYNNGNGATPFGLSFDYGTASALQAYERWKYIQRRGTAETLFGRNAQLVTGVTRNFAYNNEAGGPFTEDEILAWGSEVTYSAQTVNFTVGEVITFSGGGRGRLLGQIDGGATGTLLMAMEPGTPTPVATETMTGVTSGGNGTVDAFVSNANAGTGLLIALDDQGTTGNLYYQAASGLNPVSTQTVFGTTSGASADVNGAVTARTINNQYVGVFTGSNFQTNFGIGVDTTDAVVGDLLRNLLDVQQAPPNNQSGVVGALVAGDAITVYPWDGVALDVNGDPEPDFDEMLLATALTAGVSTQVDVGAGNIPINTPQTGALRIERDSDSELDLVPYSSHDSDAIFTLVGTAPSAAAIGNTVMRALIDTVTAGTQESYTAVYGGTPNSVVIGVRRGGAGPIKPFVGTASFGASGFNVNAQRITDV